jgi:hypothetical protein
MFFATREMHVFFENLVVTSAPGVHVSLMDIHHDTSLRFILEDDSISSTSQAHISFYLSKGAKLWLITRPFIHSFYIAHSIFTLVLCFRFDFIQLLTSSFFMCECGHGLNASGTHLVCCPFDD